MTTHNLFRSFSGMPERAIEPVRGNNRRERITAGNPSLSMSPWPGELQALSGTEQCRPSAHMSFCPLPNPLGGCGYSKARTPSAPGQSRHEPAAQAPLDTRQPEPAGPRPDEVRWPDKVRQCVEQPSYRSSRPPPDGQAKAALTHGFACVFRPSSVASNPKRANRHCQPLGSGKPRTVLTF